MRPRLPGDAGGGEVRVPVRREEDVAIARQATRAVARAMGLRTGAVEAIATAVSEIARNIVVHARGGAITVAAVRERGRRGVRIVARDEAPGIADLERAMQDGWSSANGLGLGLPGARRLADEFAIESAPGAGTTVVLGKWADERDD